MPNTTEAPGSPAPDNPHNAPPSPSGRVSGWAKVGASLGIAIAQVVADILHPAVAEALALADVTIPVIALLIVFTVVVLGSQQTCDRVFRLLRWITNRPEPPRRTHRSPRPR